MSNLLAMFWLRPVDGINLLILLVLSWILYRVIRDEGNLIEWADFIATRGADGRQHGDLNKVGQLVGIGLATMACLMYADNETVEPTGLAALLGVSLLYLGSVTAYAANLRSKQGSITTVTEPAPSPTESKVTETKTAPISRREQ